MKTPQEWVMKHSILEAFDLVCSKKNAERIVAAIQKDAIDSIKQELLGEVFEEPYITDDE